MCRDSLFHFTFFQFLSFHSLTCGYIVGCHPFTSNSNNRGLAFVCVFLDRGRVARCGRSSAGVRAALVARERLFFSRAAVA